MFEQVGVSKEVTGRHGSRKGSSHCAANQEYQVRNTNTSLAANCDSFVFPVTWTPLPQPPTSLPFQPRSLTEKLLRKQTKSRRSVNDADVSPSILQREASGPGFAMSRVSLVCQMDILFFFFFFSSLHASSQFQSCECTTGWSPKRDPASELVEIGP